MTLVTFFNGMLTYLISSMFAATLPTFWPLNKFSISFWGCSFIRFRTRLPYDKICKGFRLDLNTSFFLLNSLEQSLILFQLLIFLYLIVNDCEISLKCRAKVVEYPNFECVFNRNTLHLDTSFESIVLGRILCHIFADDIGEFADGSDGCPLTCGILKSIPRF